MMRRFKTEPQLFFHILRPSFPCLLGLSDEEIYRKSILFRDVTDLYYQLNHEQYIHDEEITDIDNEKLLKSIFPVNIIRNNSPSSVKSMRSLQNEGNDLCIWSYIPSELYFLFYSLKLNDIHHPEDLYLQRIDSLSLEIQEKQVELEVLSQSETQSQAAQVKQMKKEVEKLKIGLNFLKEEKVKRQNHVNSMKDKVKSVFSIINNKIQKENRKEISKYIIKHLFFPRMIISKEDSLFVSFFFEFIISTHCLFFNVLDFLTKMLKILIPSLLGLTEFEANNVGIFLYEIFNQIQKTWSNESLWTSLSKDNPCFLRNFDGQSQISQSDYKDVYYLVLKKISGNFVSYLLLEEYVSCKNSLIIMSQLGENFPSNKKSASEILKTILSVKDKIYNEDLLLRMIRYSDILKERIERMGDEKDGKDGKETKENKESKENKENKVIIKEVKENKDHKEKEKKDKDLKPQKQKVTIMNNSINNINTNTNTNTHIQSQIKNNQSIINNINQNQTIYNSNNNNNNNRNIKYGRESFRDRDRERSRTPEVKRK